MTVLHAAGLRKSFGAVRAVDGVDFLIQAGEILAMIGPNGAGKSTCFNLLGGQLRPDDGRIEFNGRNVAGSSPQRLWRLGIGRTFQIAATFASLSVRENVQMALLSQARNLLRAGGKYMRTTIAPAMDLLAQVDMADQAGRACAALAYGDLKRVELAMALANRPRLLLMDEPTAGMAPHERHALMEMVVGLARRGGMAVLFTEHDMDSVFAHADRVLVLARGRVIADGLPATVRADPQVRDIYLGHGLAGGA